ncbi:MAG TPA: PEGA domain-containing protein [Polyangia bacterium]|jgi:hypothetical protein|nr:PEGA domain-containing protein [Polyangia bacterium]
MAKAYSRIVLAGILLLVLGFCQTAIAADADLLIREGIELRRHGDDAAALARFRKAHQLDHAPRSLAQIGLAEQALGLWVAAFSHLRDALAVANDGWIQKNRTVLEQALAVINGHLGTLELAGEPEGAEVRVDGQQAGKFPIVEPLRLGVGTVVVEVASDGYVTISRPVQISAENPARERFVLQKIAGGAIPDLGFSATRSTATESIPRSPENDDRPPGRRLILAGSLAAAGLLALGWGGIETVVWQHRVSSFNNRADCWNNPPQNWAQGCADLHDQGQRAKYLAFTGYGIGVALAATSAIVFVTRPAHASTTALACVPVPTGLGAQCAFHF